MAFAPFAAIDDTASKPGTLVSAETFGQLADNVNHLVDASPVGTIAMIMVGLTGCPTPDPTIWQVCNGAAITDVNSPLKGTNTPNYVDTIGRYMKGYSALGTVGNYGGSNTKNLAHAHGGSTGVMNPTQNVADTDDDFITPNPHAHGIDSDLSAAQNVEPVHYRIAHYIKIR